MTDLGEGKPRVYDGAAYGRPGTFTVADDGGWCPGVYATEEAARFASTVNPELLAERTHWRLRGQGDAYRPVTLDELRAWVSGG